MLIILIVLILILGIYYVKYQTNIDLMNENAKEDIDDANYRNARKYYIKTRTAKVVLLASILSLIVCIICDFTSIDAKVIDYFSDGFYKEQKFDRIYYFIPLYLFAVRLLVIEVKVGDYLYKYFKVEEPEENPLKNIDVKKIIMKQPPKKKK